MTLTQISRRLSERVDGMRFSSPVAYVYNPLAYARTPHEAYLERYGGLGASAVLLGMNPGPFGMAQTGVPFGEVSAVRDWLGVGGAVKAPAREHAKRRITGFACERSEVSGRRLWGWAAERFERPERFFERFFVVNYCPLVFMEESGRNVVPEKLKKAEREPLFEACDEALRATVELLAPTHVIGIGKFGEARARQALAGQALSFGSILHPSPASPAANRGWSEQAEAQLVALGLL